MFPVSRPASVISTSTGDYRISTAPPRPPGERLGHRVALAARRQACDPVIEQPRQKLDLRRQQLERPLALERLQRRQPGGAREWITGVRAPRPACRARSAATIAAASTVLPAPVSVPVTKPPVNDSLRRARRRRRVGARLEAGRAGRVRERASAASAPATAGGGRAVEKMNVRAALSR
jgi:hypothetical protein